MDVPQDPRCEVGRPVALSPPLTPQSLALAACAVLLPFGWAYWPTLVGLVGQWNHKADYSHGYLVVPAALLFLWTRRESFPKARFTLAWPGLVVILASMGIRFVGARYYVDAIDGWSMVVWVAGVVWLLGGWRLLRWSWPSVAFLLFMIPLPWRAERLLSLPLQGIATRLSCWILQCLGQPAIAQGNTIWLNDRQIEVIEACSGLGIFMTIVALAFAFLVLFPRPWWQRGLIFASIVPIALVANATRIAATGMVGQYLSSERAQKLIHDLAGLLMIPLAAGLFALVIWYLDHLVREDEIVDVGTIAREMAR